MENKIIQPHCRDKMESINCKIDIPNTHTWPLTFRHFNWSSFMGSKNKGEKQINFLYSFSISCNFSEIYDLNVIIFKLHVFNYQYLLKTTH